MSFFDAFDSGRLTRRAMLRGLGVTMALPWLESLPAWADDSATGKPAARAAGPHGRAVFGQRLS